jgi:branched-chain amino acid transport system substrate-binding protein
MGVHMKRIEQIRRVAQVVLAVSTTVAAMPAFAQPANEMFFPLLSVRTGAFAPVGIPRVNGFIDYLKLVNTRDGGVNGVKIAHEECETAYATDRGVECYERLKSKKPIGVNPMATGIIFALAEKAPIDKIPIFSLGYGRSESADGSVFPWLFPFLGNYWSGADIMVQHMARAAPLKGRKIALLYHDSPFGRESLPVLEAHAKKHGFALTKLPVTHPGVEQKSQWLQIRQQRPDWVILWGAGAMNAIALKEAVATGYPRAKMLGIWWAATEPDVSPVGADAKGYSGLAFPVGAGSDRPVHREIVKHVHDKGQGAGKREDIGQVNYNRGMLEALMVVESVRRAQKRFGNRAMTGEEVRWGAENLDIDAARIVALGFEGMMKPLKTSCADHEGARSGRVHTWDGKAWRDSSDWYTADAEFLKPIARAASAQYVKEKNIAVRDCAKEK